MRLDDAKHGKVDSHDDESDDPGEKGDSRSEDGTAYASAQREKESDESEYGGYGVKNKGLGETVCRVTSGSSKVCLVNFLDNRSRFISDGSGEAKVLVGAGNKSASASSEDSAPTYLEGHPKRSIRTFQRSKTSYEYRYGW